MREELQRQGSARVSSATGRIRRGERVGEPFLAIAHFHWSSFLRDNEFKKEIVSARRRNQARETHALPRAQSWI
jgi:hypothetical protein